MNQELQTRAKHVPLRTCIVCREKSSKRTLTRIVRADQGVQVDPGGKLSGRGAYLCDQPACWERALSTDVLSRALRTTLSADDRDRLRRLMPQPQ